MISNWRHINRKQLCVSGDDFAFQQHIHTNSTRSNVSFWVKNMERCSSRRRWYEKIRWKMKRWLVCVFSLAKPKPEAFQCKPTKKQNPHSLSPPPVILPSPTTKKDASGLGSTRGVYKFTTELLQTAIEESRHMQTEFMVISKLNEGRLRDTMPIAQQTSVTTFNPNQPFNSMLSNLRDVFVPLTSMMSKIEEERKTTDEKPTRRLAGGRRRGNERLFRSDLTSPF